MEQDILLELYNSIPENVECQSEKEVQQKIMHACWTYNKLITDQVQCSVCKWTGSIRPQITKYLKGIGKI